MILVVAPNPSDEAEIDQRNAADPFDYAEPSSTSLRQKNGSFVR
jgi:hypothetical protein